MQSSWQRLKVEMINVIPAIIFFLISFNLINLTERLIIRTDEINGIFLSYWSATIAALVVGKIIIIVNSFSFINLFPEKPLIYNISWKFLVYGVLTFLFRVVESGVHFVIDDKHTMTLAAFVMDKLTSPLFWAIQMWILMTFILYIIASEFCRVLGGKKVREMVLG